jgi:hypothetical protein
MPLHTQLLAVPDAELGMYKKTHFSVHIYLFTIADVHWQFYFVNNCLCTLAVLFVDNCSLQKNPAIVTKQL